MENQEIHEWVVKSSSTNNINENNNYNTYENNNYNTYENNIYENNINENNTYENNTYENNIREYNVYENMTVKINNYNSKKKYLSSSQIILKTANIVEKIPISQSCSSIHNNLDYLNSPGSRYIYYEDDLFIIYFKCICENSKCTHVVYNKTTDQYILLKKETIQQHFRNNKISVPYHFI